MIQIPILATLPITIDGSGPGSLTSRWLIGQSEGFFTLGANASPANRLLSDDTVVAVDDLAHISGVVQICDSSPCDGNNPSYSRVFDGDGVVNLAGKSVTTDEQSILGLNVTHSFTIVDGPGVARAFLTLQNPTSDDISIVVRSGFNLSSQDIVAASSSGDTTFDTADRWLIVRRGTASNPPTTVDTMVHFGPGAPAVTPSEVGKGADVYQASFPVTVPAGETVHLMWFLGMHLDQTGAMADVGIFDDVTSASVLVADLTAAQRSRIVNWDFRDLDGDGIPDYMDNCPETPNPDQDESACAVEPPDTTITSAPPDPSTSASASFTFTSTAAGSTFECRLDDGAFGPCSSPQTYTGLADGSHAFQVRATDPSGNADPTPVSHTWSIDATPPDTIITSGPLELTTSTTATVTFMSTEVSSFECSLDGSAFAACTTPRDYSGLADGIHTFRVRAIDAVGNPDPTPASLTWTVDTTAPDTSITSGPPATATSNTASLGFTSTESGAFECSLDGSPFTGCTSPAEYSGLALGSHAFQVRAMDVAGNVDPTPASHSWTIQAADDAPTISGFSPASGGVATSVTISGVNLAGTSAVMFNGVQATYKVQGRTKITATVPLGATTGPIAVTAPGGMATSVTSFTVIPAPAITGFSPASGRAGSSVTITGTNLGGATAVRFNGSTAKFTIVSTTALTATVPNGAKTGPISVTTPGGTATSAAIFTVTK
jgi:hypothetical protein